MKIKTPTDSSDNPHFPEVFVELHEEEGKIVIRSSPAIISLIRKHLVATGVAGNSLIDPLEVKPCSPEELSVPLSFGMAELLAVIRKALDSVGYVFSEPFGETAETLNHIFRLQAMSGKEFCDNWDNICSEYEMISKRWYGGIQGYVKATVRRKDEMSCDSEGYDNDRNEIWICAPEKEHKDGFEESILAKLAALATGIENRKPESEQFIQWPGWKSVVVHEAIHEYEKKVIKDEVTITGRALYERFRDRFPYPEKHDERFFTAVADRSEYFELTPEELVLKI